MPEIRINRHIGGFCAVFQSKISSDELRICLGDRVVTINDHRLGIYYVGDSRIAEDFYRCNTPAAAESVWQGILLREMRCDTSLLLHIAEYAYERGLKDGADKQISIIRKALGLTS